MSTPPGHRVVWLFLLSMAWPGLWLSGTWAQAPQPPTGQTAAPPRPVRITMDELHRHGGVPPGWKFTLPEGDAKAGRTAFVDLQCYTCHTIAGEEFPPVKPAERAPAPDLTGVGPFHPAVYFAEAILNPSAVIVEGPGYVDANGLSNMPNYTDVLTVRQLLDLVAYLQSLRASEASHHHGSSGHGHQHGTSPQPHHDHGSHAPARPAKK